MRVAIAAVLISSAVTFADVSTPRTDASFGQPSPRTLPDTVAISVSCCLLIGERGVFLTIQRADGGGYVDNRQRHYDVGEIKELVDRVREPTGDAVSLATLHIDRAELVARAESLMEQWRLPRPERVELRRRMGAPGFLEGVVKGHFRGRVPDHHCHTTIELRSGAMATMVSSSVIDPFGVPWQVDRRQSWDIRLGRAISALLPSDVAPEREQFMSADFLDRLAEEWVRRAAAPH